MKENYLFDNIVVSAFGSCLDGLVLLRRRFILFSLLSRNLSVPISEMAWYCSVCAVWMERIGWCERTKCTNNLKFRNAAGKMWLSSSSWGHATAVAIQLKPSHIYGTDKTTKNSFLSRLLFVSYFMEPKEGNELKRKKIWAKNVKKERKWENEG